MRPTTQGPPPVVLLLTPVVRDETLRHSFCSEEWDPGCDGDEKPCALRRGLSGK